MLSNGLRLAGLLATIGAVLSFGPTAMEARAEKPLSTERFAQVRSLIAPRLGEAAWLDIPWEIDVWEARKRAAAEGKPIFFLTGGGASPLGEC